MPSKFCPIHGTEDVRHAVNHCTCESAFPINLIGELIAVTFENIRESIQLPDWKRTLKGTVIARGPYVRDVREGQVVGFGATVGMDSVFAGQEIRILKEQDLDFIYEA